MPLFLDDRRKRRRRLLGMMIGPPSPFSFAPPPPPSGMAPWILAMGVWNDTGRWMDEQVWID